MDIEKLKKDLWSSWFEENAPCMEEDRKFMFAIVDKLAAMGLIVGTDILQSKQVDEGTKKAIEIVENFVIQANEAIDDASHSNDLPIPSWYSFKFEIDMLEVETIIAALEGKKVV